MSVMPKIRHPTMFLSDVRTELTRFMASVVGEVLGKGRKGLFVLVEHLTKSLVSSAYTRGATINMTIKCDRDLCTITKLANRSWSFRRSRAVLGEVWHIQRHNNQCFKSNCH
jgi:hypothetical protein